MPVAQTRLEQLQVLKLLQSVRAEDKTQIEKLATHGIPDLINYSGLALFYVYIYIQKTIACVFRKY